MRKKTIRVHRRDSAFVYAILESLEGMASVSTRPNAPGQEHRDLEICVPTAFVEEIGAALQGLRKKFPILEISA